MQQDVTHAFGQRVNDADAERILVGAECLGLGHYSTLTHCRTLVKWYAANVATPTPQYVRDLSLTGEFNTLTDDQINYVIEDEVVYMYQSPDMVAEDLHTRVVGLHTAHILKTGLSMGGNGNNGQQGPLIQAKVGQLEKRWGLAQAPQQPGDGLDTTTEYGRRCLRLLKSRFPSLRTTQP